MLVVMHYRNIQFNFKALLNLKTLRSLNVLEIDTTECWGNSLYGFNKFIRILLIYFDVKYVNTSINFKKESFTFHDRLAAYSPNITKSEYRCTVADNSNKVTFICILICVIRILLNFETWLSYTW